MSHNFDLNYRHRNKTKRFRLTYLLYENYLFFNNQFANFALDAPDIVYTIITFDTDCNNHGIDQS